MLKGIAPLLSPDLLKILCEMGHGDEIVLADANFPAAALGKRVIYLPGADGPRTLQALLSVLPLDQYDTSHFVLMEVVPGDPVVPTIWEEYKTILKHFEPKGHVSTMERFAFYERARKAYAVVSTLERAQYANIILKKGCVLP